MRILFSSLFLILITIKMTGMPSDGILREYLQPDGRPVTVKLCGDEHFHFFMTKDGFVVTENEKEGFNYGILKDNILTSSGISAHDEGYRDSYERQYLTIRKSDNYEAHLFEKFSCIHSELLTDSNERRIKLKTRGLGEPGEYYGRKKGLVILVDFPNQKMASTNPNLDYDRMFNNPGYSDNNHVGSVRDYFLDQSYGQFDLSFDVVGPVTVSNNYGYYGSDFPSGGHDINVGEMIVEACLLADIYIDYRDYDWDRDGIVDQIFIIYAGYGQATGGPSNTIWPHEYYISENLILDGVKISQYACSNELYGRASDPVEFMGIGCACHEFSHCLGLPDLYDTDYSGAYGMSYWALMNSGSYSGPKGHAEVPCGYTAYERYFAGWLDFIDIEVSQKIENLPSLEDSPVAYRIINEGHPDEFFTFENRQPDKWFKYLSSMDAPNGLLVTHIDYDFKSWVVNRVNPSQSRQRMSPVVADNEYGSSYESIAGDLFPGIGNITSLTNTSHTEGGGKLYNKNTDGSYNMNKSILNIKEEEGLISFDVIFNYEIPVPTALPATDISESAFTANWTAENADSYSLEITITRKLKPFFQETKLIENIPTPYYNLTEIGEAEFCIYRVRSNKDDLQTEWSNPVNVNLKDINGVEIIPDDIAESQGKAYNLNGILLRNESKGNVFIREGKKIIRR